MKPMVLKVASACCGSPTLLYLAATGHYSCPCGKLKADMNGQLVKKRPAWNKTRTK